MFTDRTQIAKLTSFANELEALQRKIRTAQEEIKQRGDLRLISRPWEAAGKPLASR
jgi:hypothetical protein